MHGGLKPRVLKDNLKIAVRWLIIKKYKDNLKFKITRTELLHISLLLPHYSICFPWFTMTQKPKNAPVTGKAAVIARIYFTCCYTIPSLIFQIHCESYLKNLRKKTSHNQKNLAYINFYTFTASYTVHFKGAFVTMSENTVYGALAV